MRLDRKFGHNSLNKKTFSLASQYEGPRATHEVIPTALQANQVEIDESCRSRLP